MLNKQTQNKKQKQTAIAKQTTVITVLLCIVVVLLVVWISTKDMLKVVDTEPVQTDAELKYNEGDALGTNDKFNVYDAIDTANIKDITIKNDYGTYRVYRDKDGIPQIAGYEGIAFHEESMSALMTSLGTPTAMYRVEYPDDLAQYGLAPRTLEDGTVKNPATFEFVAELYNEETGETEDVTYSGLVGDKTVTGGGYYFIYNGTPDVVYVISTSVEEAVLAPVETLVAPMIVAPMTDNDYYIVHDFILMKGEETIVHIDYIEEEERANSELVTQTYRMISHPDLIPAAEAVSAAMIGFHTAAQTDAMATVESALEVVHLGIDDEALEKYNLGDNCYKLYYTYKGTENFLLISPRNSDGSFYAASPLFRQIVKGGSDVFDFVTWDLFDWVEAPFFQMKINYITDITVQSGDYNVTFDLTHVDAGVNSNGVDMGTDLDSVVERGTGKEMDVETFRQFYKTLLYACYEGESGLMEDELERFQSSADSEAQLILTIHTESGREMRYRFFRYTERKSYIELNGEGQFYCLRTMADKILADAKRVQNGDKIVSTDKY